MIFLSLAEVHGAGPRGDRREVGGKVWSLARLAHAGVEVPDGFVIPAAAFRAWLRTRGLWETAERAAGGEAEAARALRTAILERPLGSAAAAALAARAEPLGARVAVRSSAADEDGRRRSFAGQHLSELGVASARLEASVRRCWASLYSDEALAYRRGAGPAPGSMAVLVQRIVEPVASGVLFTVNPLNGSWREMVVESVWGLGEGLVGGQIAPHWFVVRRPRRLPGPVERLWARVRLQVMQQDVPQLTHQVVLADEGTATVPVPADRRDRPTLERATLLRLCRVGLKVERALGQPQDVEWALDGSGRIVVLQARPVTSTGTPRARRDVLYTRRFIGERWPEPATPLGWSIMKPLFEWFIAYPSVQDRYLGGGPSLKLVGGRPYINTTVFRHLAFKLPGAPPPRFMLELVPPDEERAWRQRFAVFPDISVYGSILRVTRQERRWERFRWNPFTNHRVWVDFEAQLGARLDGMGEPHTPAEALRLVDDQIELVRQYIAIHLCSLLFAHLWYQLLESGLASWMPERASALMDGLATCPPGNLTLETNAAMWALARSATPEELDRLEAGENLDPHTPFARELDAFLERFGHRSEASWEILSTRWRADPRKLVPLLRAQRGAPADPRERAVAQQDAFEAAAAEVAATLSGTPRLLLDNFVFFTRRYLLLRENQRFWFDRLLWSLQQTFVWIGRHLEGEGFLDQADDIALLTWPEVQGLLDGSLTDRAAVARWVTRRRARRERELTRYPPVFIVGEHQDEEPVEGNRLQGLGISPGRARGRVRVVHSLADSHRLEPGEILVTRAVDPGWTPLFLTAAAVVLEMGSVLSHGAVVAREYKVPAVVNLEGIVRRLTDGQEVTVDGTRGVVWVHP